MVFHQLKLFEKIGPRRPNRFDKNKKKNEARSWEGHPELACKISIFTVYIVKTVWAFGLLCGKHVKIA